MLTGDLVRLRPYQMTDLDRIMTWVNDPEVTQYMSAAMLYGATIDQEEVWLRATVNKIRPPDIVYAIETIEDEPVHIGSIGLHDIGLESRKAVLGIMIGDKNCWSRGYGTDAIRTLLRFAVDEINLHRVWLEVHATTVAL